MNDSSAQAANLLHATRFADRDWLMRFMGGGVGHSNHYTTETEPINLERGDEEETTVNRSESSPAHLGTDSEDMDEVIAEDDISMDSELESVESSEDEIGLDEDLGDGYESA